MKYVNMIKNKAPFIYTFGLIFISSSIVSFALYFGLKAIMGGAFSCGFFFRCWPYWEFYPIPYLLALAFTYAGVTSLWFSTFGRSVTRFPYLQLALLPIVSLLPAGFMCGMIWAYHDMAAGFFPQFSWMINYIWEFAWLGFQAAPFIALTSFPLNVLGFLFAYLIAAFTAKRLGLQHYRFKFLEAKK